MYDRVERHFAVLRAAVDDAGGEVFATMGDGIAAAFTSADGAPCRRRSRRSGRCRRSASPCGWASTPARSSASATTSAAGRSTGRRGSWPSVTAARSCCPTCRRRSCARAGVPVDWPTSARIGCATSPSPSGCGRSCTPSSRQQFPPVRGVDTYSNNLPAQRIVAGRPRRSTSSASSPWRQRHRIVTLTGVGGVGKTRLAVHAAADLLGAVRQRVVRRASPASPTPTTSPTRSPCRSAAAAVGRSAGRGRRPRWPANGRCSSSTTASTCRRRGRGDRRADGALSRPVGHRDQPRGARHRRRARRRRAPARPGDDRRRAVPPAGRGRRRRPRRRCDRASIERAVPPPRRHPARHRAGRGADRRARRRRDRRRARRPARPAGGRPPAWRRPPRHDAGHHRVVVPAARRRRAADVPVARRVPQRLRARRRPPRRRACSASTSRRPPSTSTSLVHKSMVAPERTPTACATGCSRRCAPSPSSSSTSAASGCRR